MLFTRIMAIYPVHHDIVMPRCHDIVAMPKRHDFVAMVLDARFGVPSMVLRSSRGAAVHSGAWRFPSVVSPSSQLHAPQHHRKLNRYHGEFHRSLRGGIYYYFSNISKWIYTYIIVFIVGCLADSVLSAGWVLATASKAAWRSARLNIVSCLNCFVIKL